jgi:hypothetical protein
MLYTFSLIVPHTASEETRHNDRNYGDLPQERKENVFQMGILFFQKTPENDQVRDIPPEVSC